MMNILFRVYKEKPFHKFVTIYNEKLFETEYLRVIVVVDLEKAL